jgi:di/tricarboxylate transporter
MDLLLPYVTMGIVLVAMISFALERIPIAMTAIGASLLLGVIGAIELQDVYSAFGSDVTVFCAGMMVVGNTLFRTGFADAVARGIERLGLYRNERLLVIVVTAAAAFLSAWLSNSAVVAMFIPLVALIAARSGGRIRMPIALMGTGIGAAIGGISTLTGSTTQLITQGILQETDGAEPMGLFTLTRIGGPLVLITILYMATVGYSIGRRVLDFEPPDLLAPQGEPGQADAATVPRWRLWFSMAVMVAIILAFAFGLWNIAIVSLIGASIMILSGCMPYREALRGIDWNTLVILSAAQALGLGLTASGAGQLIADAVVGAFGSDLSPWAVLCIFVALATILTNLASNTALVVMLVPIVMSVADGLGADPTSWAIVVTIACNLAVGTQTMVGGFRFLDYVKVGGPLVLILGVATAVLAPVAYPF